MTLGDTQIKPVPEKVVVSQLTSYAAAAPVSGPTAIRLQNGHSTETVLLKIKADMDAILDDAGPECRF